MTTTLSSWSLSMTMARLGWCQLSSYDCYSAYSLLFGPTRLLPRDQKVMAITHWSCHVVVNRCQFYRPNTS
ncbi:hypothetical protein BDD12DRAFT_856193 [Trichophaea hybrida]|nr:hypothetical protein BDD12DRAFT_856193 [Trichophaea hybrida]